MKNTLFDLSIYARNTFLESIPKNACMTSGYVAIRQDEANKIDSIFTSNLDFAKALKEEEGVKVFNCSTAHGRVRVKPY